MQSETFDICDWFYNTPFRALERAYKASKRIKYVHTLYLGYTKKNTLKCSWTTISLYMDTVLHESSFQIYWALLEFKMSSFLLYNTKIFLVQNCIQLIRSKWLIFSFNKERSTNYLYKYLHFNLTKIKSLNKKKIWIEATLDDLNLLKNQCFIPGKSLKNETNKFNLSSGIYTKPIRTGITYESVGLIPRSITKTLSRFKTELVGQSASLVIPEFQLAKYQAATSLQYMFFLICFPWFFSFFCKVIIFEPIVGNLWNTIHTQIFLNSSQEQTALKHLQEVEELLWLDIVMTNNSAQNLQDFSTEIHNQTIRLVNEYNLNSIQILLHLVMDFVSLISITLILTWGKKRLAILNSWVQELFYSLSDTMKAFFILLLTDLCIGFHSPHGWEILIGLLLEHLGFAHNKHVISCFVSTFPVVLDTVFKYWIFRHLNRISPSIVVTYHTMNE